MVHTSGLAGGFDLAKAREAKKAEKEKYEALLSALAESGKSVDDLLEELKK